MVVYQALYGDYQVYVRPLEMFISPVDRKKYPDAVQEYRFEQVFPGQMDKLEKNDICIQLVSISIQDAQPPTTEVMTAFKAVETAKQGKETALNNANKYRNEQIPQAKAEADKILQDAEAQKESRINEAEGQASRFNSMYEEYIKYPSITKQRMFYETMEDILPDMKVIIEGANGSQIQQLLPLDSFNTAEATEE